MSIALLTLSHPHSTYLHQLPRSGVDRYKPQATLPPGNYSKSFSLIRTLFTWKSSVWRAVWKELALWLVLYYCIHFTYLYGMEDSTKRHFEKWCKVGETHPPAQCSAV